jgi:hypothetical protein
MANVKASLSGIKIGDTLDATVHFLDVDAGVSADVTVKLPPTDRPLSDIGAEAIAKAKVFLRRVTET